MGNLAASQASPSTAHPLALRTVKQRLMHVKFALGVGVASDSTVVKTITSRRLLNDVAYLTYLQNAFESKAVRRWSAKCQDCLGKDVNHIFWRAPRASEIPVLGELRQVPPQLLLECMNDKRAGSSGRRSQL